MKVVCLLGSPRPKGNSAAVAAKFMETAEGLGAQTETFSLNQLEYKGCQGCYACKTKKESCALSDGLTPVLEAVRGCDVLVLASPIYYGDVTSQTKAFVDRSFSFLKPDYMTNPQPARLALGKKAVWIMPQEDKDPKHFSDVYPKYSYFFGFYGFESQLIRPLGVNEPGEVSAQAEIMAQAEQAANALIS